MNQGRAMPWRHGIARSRLRPSRTVRAGSAWAEKEDAAVTRIVVLDGYTLNPGDLSWAPLEALGSCSIHERTPPDAVVDRLRGAEIALTNKTVLSAEILAQAPALRYIGVLATGYNVVDVGVAAARGIPVTNVPEYSTASVAQMVFAHVLHHCSRVAEQNASVRAGDWNRSPDFSYCLHPLQELSGMTMGVVGFGRIGSAVARLAQTFGMHVLAHAPRPPPSPPDGVRLVPLETLFRDSDVISLHCPLTDENRMLVNANRLALMKPSALLINTARGGLVDEAALADALHRGAIAGAGLDVLTQEPPRDGSPLLHAENCTLTPHVAWATRAARSRLLQTATENVRVFLAGSPRNVVNRA
jgi:glycerate dehydrogenase